MMEPRSNGLVEGGCSAGGEKQPDSEHMLRQNRQDLLTGGRRAQRKAVEEDSKVSVPSR